MLLRKCLLSRIRINQAPRALCLSRQTHIHKTMSQIYPSHQTRTLFNHLGYLTFLHQRGHQLPHHRHRPTPWGTINQGRYHILTNRLKAVDGVIVYVTARALGRASLALCALAFCMAEHSTVYPGGREKRTRRTCSVTRHAMGPVPPWPCYVVANVS
jgi:hypothetical protein